MSSYPELSDNFGSFCGQLTTKGTSSSKQKEASKSKLELDNTPEPNFDLLGSEDDLELNDNSQESDSGQVQQSQSLIGGKESEISTKGKESRSLVSQLAERGIRSQALIGQQDACSPPILSYVELRNDICSAIAPTATPLANFDLEMSEDMFAQDDDGEDDSFMVNQVLTQKEAPRAKSPSPSPPGQSYHMLENSDKIEER